MGTFNFKAYGALFGCGVGVRAVVGGTLARFFIAMCTLAFLSLYTQSGYSYSLAGIGVSIVQCSNFLISPRISRLVDRYGQSRVVPIAAAIGMAVGPTVGGIVLDTLGTGAAFAACAASGLAIPSLFVLSIPVLRKRLSRAGSTA